MYEVEAYEQEFHSADVCHRHVHFDDGYEDIKLTFLDVSYDEEVAQSNHHNCENRHSLLMRNTSNYVIHPIKYKNIFSIKIYQLE